MSRIWDLIIMDEFSGIENSLGIMMIRDITQEGRWKNEELPQLMRNQSLLIYPCIELYNSKDFCNFYGFNILKRSNEKFYIEPCVEDTIINKIDVSLYPELYETLIKLEEDYYG